MLQPIHKQEGSTPGERALEKLASSSFFDIWCYVSVHRPIQSGGGSLAHEVADLLVLFGRDLVIFSEKDIKFSDANDIKLAWSRWFRRSVVDSVKQLRGAEKYIRTGSGSLFLDAKCTQPFPFSLHCPDIRVHLVSIVRNTKEPCQRYFDQFLAGSSGSLVFNRELRESEMLANPFFIGDFDPASTFVHVFDEDSLSLLINELDSCSDFINYLVTREDAIRYQHLITFYGEEDFLGVYLSKTDSEGFGMFIDDSLIPRNPEKDCIIIEEHTWQEFLISPEYKLHQDLLHQANTWKQLINNLSLAIVNAKVGKEAQDMSFHIHERAVRAIASENTYARAILSQFFTEIYNVAPSKSITARIMSSPLNPTRLYVFLVFPKLETHESYEAYRKERFEWIKMYAACAQVQYTIYTEIVVLGVDTKESEGGSETVLVVDAYPDMPQDEKEKRLKLIQEFGLFTGKNASMISIQS